MVLIQSFTSWILLNPSIIGSFGPLTDSETLSYQVFIQSNSYCMEVRTWDVSNGLVEELESTVSGNSDEGSEEKDSESVRDQISGAHHCEISTDGSGCD